MNCPYVASVRKFNERIYVHQCEYGLLCGSRYSEGGPRVTRTSCTEKNVLDTVRRNLCTRVQDITAAVEGSQSSVRRVLQREDRWLHSYQLQSVPSRIVIQINKHPAVWCVSLWVPFAIQSFS
ncbi:hypothetical protein TNCV_3314911 [Trichonephila clavipes]|nr:hypothetical protein TNCV_3314911 [Trichonephila clavipes]